MDNESQETLLKENTILDAINLLRQEFIGKFDDMRQEFNGKFDDMRQEINGMRQEINGIRLEMDSMRLIMTERFSRIENDGEEIKNLQFSFDVQLERIESATHKSLSIGHDLRADVKILRAEVTAWANNVMRLEKQPS